MLLGGLANNNVIEGNIIGLDASASHTPVVSQIPMIFGTEHVSGQYIGVWISDGSTNRLGGSAAGSGNLIAGNLRGVYITGPSAAANWVTGNRIGWAPTSSGFLDAVGVLLGTNVQQNLIGGSLGGNTIVATEGGIIDSGNSDTLQGNWIGNSPDSKPVIPVGFGIITLGAHSPFITQNTIANSYSQGIQLAGSSSSRLSGNRITAPGREGIRVLDSAGTVISSNTIVGAGTSKFRGNGIYVMKDVAQSGLVTLSQNSVSGSSGLGISFNLAGTPTFVDSSQPIRILFSQPPPVWSNGQLQITGSLEAPAGVAAYTLEFFVNASASLSGYGEGQTFIGSAIVSVDPLGNGAINASFACPSCIGQFLAATATDGDGSTTEFSHAVMIQPCAPGPKGICPGLEANVPNPPRSRAAVRPMSASSFGDGNGDGILDSQQANIASLPSLPGLWVTLSAPGGTVLEHVTPTGPPDFASLPAGYSFPIGFLSFGITKIPAGGTVTLTNYLHLDADPDFSYAATTYFNFGPTPDNRIPHWYEFRFDGTTGAELLSDRIILHFQDGRRGDDDVSPNGEIVTVGAPAYALAPAPRLSLRVTSVASSNIIDIVGGTNETFVLATNTVPVVTCLLSWPVTADNYGLEFWYDLSSQNLFDGLSAPLWQTVPATPEPVNGWNCVTNTTLHSTGFYRLSPNPE